jgi:hypothetical protein
MTRKWLFWHTMTLIVSAAIASGQAIAQDDTPQTTADGLELVASPLRAFYLRPGTTLDKYQRIVMLESFVEFRKNWLRDNNRGKRSFNEITDEDMEYIKESLAGEFREVVTEALQEDVTVPLDPSIAGCGRLSISGRFPCEHGGWFSAE